MRLKTDHSGAEYYGAEKQPVRCASGMFKDIGKEINGQTLKNLRFFSVSKRVIHSLRDYEKRTC